MPTLDKRTTREQDRHCAGRPVGKSSDLVSIATVIRGSTTGGRGRMAVGGNKLEQNGEILGSNGFLYPKLKVDVAGEIGTGPVLGIRHGTGRPPACDRAHETTAMRFAGKSSDRATETRAGQIVMGKSIDQREQTLITEENPPSFSGSIPTGELTPWPPQHRSKPTAAMRRGAPGRKRRGERPAYGATPSSTA